MFKAGGTADKKKTEMNYTETAFCSNVFFHFCSSGPAIQHRQRKKRGMGDNSNSTAKFKIQFMNSRFL